MTRRDDQRLADMRQFLDELEAITGKGREAFDDDPVLRRAAERLLEIVGEAAKGISEQGRAQYPTADWRGAAQFRDVLAHRYFRVDYDQIWTIASTDAPRLREALRGPQDAA